MKRYILFLLLTPMCALGVSIKDLSHNDKIEGLLTNPDEKNPNNFANVLIFRFETAPGTSLDQATGLAEAPFITPTPAKVAPYVPLSSESITQLGLMDYFKKSVGALQLQNTNIHAINPADIAAYPNLKMVVLSDSTPAPIRESNRTLNPHIAFHYFPSDRLVQTNVPWPDNLRFPLTKKEAEEAKIQKSFIKHLEKEEAKEKAKEPKKQQSWGEYFESWLG